ncbi:MAG: TRAP transporter substrate-binding protein DctP [Chloroflexi bacterium]|nr:TRAP transporter substrate-binding protein DctP [Chloroflexota bacterium]
MRKVGLISLLLVVMSVILAACSSDPTAVPTRAAPTAEPTAMVPSGATLEEYAAAHAGGPGAIYVGDLSQLVGLAPSDDLGGFDGEVPLDALQEHTWIYESDYYNKLPAKAKLLNPTELVSSGESFQIQHACINRTLLWCKLIEAYLIPNLTERTNGQIDFSVSSFPELGLAGTDTMSLVRDGTLGAVEIYSGYVGGEYPAIEIQALWGLWPSHQAHYEAQVAIFPDMEKIFTDETGAVVWSKNWLPGDDQMFFSGKKLTTLADFEGLKTRSHSAALSDWIEGMGAEAQFVAFAEVYSALERGILDAGVTGASPGHAQRWYEVTEYMNGGLRSFNSTTNVLNKDVWARMPADLQQIMIEEGAKLELEALRIASIQNKMGIARNIADGMEYVPFSDELNTHSFEVAAMQHVVPAWVKRVGGPNHPTVTETFNKKVGPIVGLEIVADDSEQGFVIRKIN